MNRYITLFVLFICSIGLGSALGFMIQQGSLFYMAIAVVNGMHVCHFYCYLYSKNGGIYSWTLN